MYREDVGPLGPPKDARYRERLKTEGTDLWQENFELLDKMKGLPEALSVVQFAFLKEYCEARKESCELKQQLVDANTDETSKKLQEVEQHIAEVLDHIKKLNK